MNDVCHVKKEKTISINKLSPALTEGVAVGCFTIFNEKATVWILKGENDYGPKKPQFFTNKVGQN